MEGLADAALEDGQCFMAPTFGPWRPSSVANVSGQPPPPTICSEALSVVLEER